MRLHLVAFPHHKVDLESSCSFSANTAAFQEMMQARGHEVVLHGGDVERDDVPVEGQWEHPMWGEYNARLTEELKSTEGIICLITGWPHLPLLTALPGRTFVEISPGYQGVLPSGSHRVFESHAWRHWIAGRDHNLLANPGDTVIGHYYDKDRFPLGTDDGYLLFTGRANGDKGIAMVLEAANRSGYPLVTIGHGSWPIGVDARGFVSTSERNKLMGNAHALLCPTLYIEPGGHVGSEALMCGTPVITSDWGCFSEWIENGFNGFRCSAIDEMVAGIAKVGDLDRVAIQRAAHARWSYEAVAPQFERYFERIS